MCAELTLLEADDSLDNNETVSLNAESLSGLSVRGSRAPTTMLVMPFSECELLLPPPLSEEPEMESVAPDMLEFVRECVRVEVPLCGAVEEELVVLNKLPAACITKDDDDVPPIKPTIPPPTSDNTLALLICASSRLNSPNITSSSDSCVSSRFAIEMRYVLLVLASEVVVDKQRSLYLRNLTVGGFSHFNGLPLLLCDSVRFLIDSSRQFTDVCLSARLQSIFQQQRAAQKRYNSMKGKYLDEKGITAPRTTVIETAQKLQIKVIKPLEEPDSISPRF